MRASSVVKRQSTRTISRLRWCRRNVVTRDVEINELIGTEFFVGEVRLRAHRITQPCLYLENLLSQPGLYKALWDNGGISCEIMTDGIIKEGDIITTVPD